jgi:hypothetical protein
MRVMSLADLVTFAAFDGDNIVLCRHHGVVGRDLHAAVSATVAEFVDHHRLFTLSLA